MHAFINLDVQRWAGQIIPSQRRAYFGMLFCTVLFIALTTACPALASDCFRTSFSKPLDWVSSGAWTQNGRALLVADPLAGDMFRVSLDGSVDSVFVAGKRSLGVRCSELSLPWSIRSVDGGFLLEDEGVTPSFPDRIWLLDPDMKCQNSLLIKGNVLDKKKKKLHVVYDWFPMKLDGKGDTIGVLAFGDIKTEYEKSKDGWESAFLYIDNKGMNRVYKSMGANEKVAPARAFYTRDTFDFITSTHGGTVGFFLLVDGTPRIVKVTASGSEELPYFPSDFRLSPPPLPDLSKVDGGFRRATYFYGAVQSAKSVIGLYSWDDRLYLLAKEPMIAGKTAWWLIEVDPDDGQEVSRTRLPSFAANLTLIPGDYWAVIEKGAVQGLTKRHAPFMESDSLVFVPSTWSESAFRNCLSLN